MEEEPEEGNNVSSIFRSVLFEKVVEEENESHQHSSKQKPQLLTVCFFLWNSSQSRAADEGEFARLLVSDIPAQGTKKKREGVSDCKSHLVCTPREPAPVQRHHFLGILVAKQRENPTVYTTQSKRELFFPEL